MQEDLPVAKKIKIIWAVEPFPNEKAILQSAALCLRAFVKSVPAEVEPIYVWPTSPVEVWISPDRSTLKLIQEQAQQILKSSMSRIKMPGLLPLRILTANAQNLRLRVNDLMQYAYKKNADLVVVSSHGRKGIKRFFLGSFAETLTFNSKIPLLVVHAGWKGTSEFKNILFPTDFSKESIVAFSQVMALAEKKKSRIILFHRVENMVYPAFDLALSDQTYFQKAIEDALAENEKTAHLLSERAKRRGITVDVVIERSGGGSVSEAILKQCKRLSCSMVVLVSHRGPVSSVLMGSKTRQVVRSSKQPVWIIPATNSGVKSRV